MYFNKIWIMDRISMCLNKMWPKAAYSHFITHQGNTLNNLHCRERMPHWHWQEFFSHIFSLIYSFFVNSIIDIDTVHIRPGNSEQCVCFKSKIFVAKCVHVGNNYILILQNIFSKKYFCQLYLLLDVTSLRKRATTNKLTIKFNLKLTVRNRLCSRQGIRQNGCKYVYWKL